jgi:hypothetical protein
MSTKRGPTGCGVRGFSFAPLESEIFAPVFGDKIGGMLFRVTASLAILASMISSAAAQTTVVGVLEDVPGTYVLEHDRRAVRVVFEKDGHEWRAFPSNCPDDRCLSTVSSEFPHEILWNVGFDGKKLGQITARTPREFRFYSDVGLQVIISQAPVPTVGQKARKYGGYIAAAVNRPLVTNSKPYFNDPESWKPLPLSAHLVHLLRQQFRRQFPKFCKLSSDQETLEPFPYADNNIRVASAYGSKNGWTVARLHLGGAVDCRDTEAGFEIDDKWFVVGPQQSVRYLDNGMWLVDAGDYDNDGRSEVIFSIDRQDEGGYELFYDHFRKSATFQFHYH